MTPAATAAAARPVLAGTGLVDGHFAAVPLGAVKGFNGGISAFFGCHGYKSEAAGTLAYFVRDETDLGDWSVLGEGVLEIVFADIEGEIADV